MAHTAQRAYIDPERLRSHICTTRWDDMNLEILRDLLHTEQATKYGASSVHHEWLLVVDERIAESEFPEK